MLSRELRAKLRLHDDRSKQSMPDLLFVDRKHVAEAVTTSPSARTYQAWKRAESPQTCRTSPIRPPRAPGSLQEPLPRGIYGFNFQCLAQHDCIGQVAYGETSKVTASTYGSRRRLSESHDRIFDTHPDVCDGASK